MNVRPKAEIRLLKSAHSLRLARSGERKCMMSLVKEKSFYRWFFYLTFSVALRNMIVFMVNLADSVMLGQYSEQALSGVALVNQIQFVLQLMVTGICEGGQIFISRAWGQRDRATMRRTANIAMKLALLIACLVAAAAAVFPSQILSLLSAEPSFVREGCGYLKIIVVTYPIFAITTSLIVDMNSVETVKLGFYTSFITLVTNVFLNYCFIYGHLGFPEMGAPGAAVATTVSRILECAAVIWYVRFRDQKLKLRLSHFGRMDRSLFIAYMKKGVPVFLSSALWGIAMSIQLGILGRLGASAITANSIANTLFQMITVLVYASASAAAVMISKTIGEGRRDLVRPYTQTMQLLFLGIGIFTGLCLFLLRRPILQFYHVSAESAVMALQFMTVLSITVMGTAYQVPCLTGILRGGGDTAFVFKNDLIFMWCLVIPCSMVVAFCLKADPVWVFFCLKSDQIIKCAVAVVKIQKYNWIRHTGVEPDMPCD